MWSRPTVKDRSEEHQEHQGRVKRRKEGKRKAKEATKQIWQDPKVTKKRRLKREFHEWKGRNSIESYQEEKRNFAMN